MNQREAVFCREHNPLFMKHILLPFLLLFSLSGASQDLKLTSENFDEKVMAYEPHQRPGVSDQDFSSGKFKLSEMKKAVSGDGNTFVYADYWNSAMAFMHLGEPAAHVEIAFQKAVDEDPESVCAVIASFGTSSLETYIPETFHAFADNCSVAKEEKIDPKTYAKEHDLDVALVQLFYQIQQNDTKYRGQTKVDWTLQTPLDLTNQHLVDSIFGVYKTYVGKSKVGEQFASTMWLVIQHSNIENMAKYLPALNKAVKADEIDANLLKMLLDRVSVGRNGYQIFGSQANEPFGTEKQRRAVIEAYDLEEE